MKRLAAPLTLLFCLAVAPIFSQEIISYANTNPNHGNDVYGSPVQQIERTPSGGFVVYGTYNSLSDNFQGLATGATDRNRFVANYAADGKIEWVRGVSTATTLRVRLRVDGTSGDIFFASQFHDSIRIGNQNFVLPSGKSDIAVGKLDKQGNFLPAFLLGVDSAYENFYDLELLPDGSILALLTTDAKGSFHNFQFPYDPALPISMLAARFSPTGDFISALHVGASEYDFGNFSMAILPNGNWTVGGGMYSGVFVFAGQPIPNGMSGVACWSPSGVLQWLKPVVSTGQECHIFDIAADPISGDLAFTGQYIGRLLEGFPADQSVYFFDVLVGKIRGADGLILWSRNGDDGSNFSEYGQKVEVDSMGNVFVMGNCKGGLSFEKGLGMCDSGPYQQAFLVKFTGGGGYSWGTCDGGGIGTDLIVMPDQTLRTVGTNASGVSWENGNFLNHWKNRSLLLSNFPNGKLCSGEVLKLNWSLVGGSFPPGAQVLMTYRTAEKELFSFSLNPVSAGGSSGSIEIPLTHGLVPPDKLYSMAISLTIDYKNSVQTPFFDFAQSPVPEFLIDPYPACVGRENFWLNPASVYQKPDVVEWQPAAKFLDFDSTAALVALAEPNVFYKVIFRDTTFGCSASDSLSLNIYDFSLSLDGPERVFGAESYNYISYLSGNGYAPFSYDWSDNLPPFVSGYAAYLHIFDTTLVGVTASDWYGCQRSDTLMVIYEPAKNIRGRILNRDSTAGMPYIPIEVYQKDKASGELKLVKLTGTYPDGSFFDEIKNGTGDTTVWLRVVPDSLQFPNDAPTWFTRKYFAQNAVPISIAADTTTLPNIRLLDQKMLPDSNGFVSGSIEKLLLKQPDATASGPAAGLTIWIADAARQPLRHTVTDANGFFKFENLPFGKFYFFVDRLGVDNSLAPYITLSAARPAAENLVGTLTSKQFFLPDFVAAAEPAAADFRLSPNPFLGKNLTGVCPSFSNREIGLSLLDAAGRLAFRQHLMTDGGGKFVVELPEGLAGGVYFLRVAVLGGGVFLKKLEISR